jgi:hypothetical protein
MDFGLIQPAECGLITVNHYRNVFDPNSTARAICAAKAFPFSVNVTITNRRSISCDRDSSNPKPGFVYRFTEPRSFRRRLIGPFCRILAAHLLGHCLNRVSLGAYLDKSLI